MSTFLPLNLIKTLGPNYNSDPEDVRNSKIALRNIGIYEAPENDATEYIDRALIDSIMRYQRIRGLRVDGVIKPLGETEEDLNRTLNELETAANSPTQRCPHLRRSARRSIWLALLLVLVKAELTIEIYNLWGQKKIDPKYYASQTTSFILTCQGYRLSRFRKQDISSSV